MFFLAGNLAGVGIMRGRDKGNNLNFEIQNTPVANNLK